MLIVEPTRTRGTSLSLFYSLNRKLIKISGHNVAKATERCHASFTPYQMQQPDDICKPPVLRKGGKQRLCKKPGPRLTPSAHDRGWKQAAGRAGLPQRAADAAGRRLRPGAGTVARVIAPRAGAVSSLWKSLKPLRIVLSHRPPSVTPYQTLFRFVRKADYDDINIQKRRRETKEEP